MELDTKGTYDTDKQTGFDPATGTLSLYFKNATEIKAGTPYIIKWPSGDNLANKVFESVKIDNSNAALIRQTVESADGSVQFIGTYSPVQIYSANHDNLFLGTGNALHYPTTDGYTINSCRAYFQLHGLTAGEVTNARMFFGDDEETMGIVEINNHELRELNELSEAWYTLDGRKLDGKPMQKGMYVNNGKKIVIK